MALPMYELGMKYAVATSDSQRMLLSAAGEAMLAWFLSRTFVAAGMILGNEE